jgi:hypothetical protein
MAMNDAHLSMLRTIATAFRAAIEAARAERVPGALPYFPEGACRMTSRLFAQHLSRRSDGVAFGRPQLVSGVLPASEHAARHSWLEIDGSVVDLTADPFGEAPVIVGARTVFHQSLASLVAEDAGGVLASLSTDETARLQRQLAAIESRLSQRSSPATH